MSNGIKLVTGTNRSSEETIHNRGEVMETP